MWSGSTIWPSFFYYIRRPYKLQYNVGHSSLLEVFWYQLRSLLLFFRVHVWYNLVVYLVEFICVDINLLNFLIIFLFFFLLRKIEYFLFVLNIMKNYSSYLYFLNSIHHILCAEFVVIQLHIIDMMKVFVWKHMR